MNENETAATREGRQEDEAGKIADMEKFEFMMLLMESRIIQPA